MKITETALTKEEKRMLRKAFVMRVIVFFLFILPLLVFSVYILYLAVLSVVEGKPDAFSYIVPLLVVLFYLGVGKFILPFYRNMFRYASARTKQVIEATVLDVFLRHNTTLTAFEIETDFGHINTARDVILVHDLPFLKIAAGMTICIHAIPGMKNEILRISACSRKESHLSSINFFSNVCSHPFFLLTELLTGLTYILVAIAIMLRHKISEM